MAITKVMSNGRQQRVRATAWVFTLNNPTAQEEKSIQEWTESNIAEYVVYGREVGASGTPHLQGYVELTGRRALGTVKGYLNRGHWEKRRGSARQASEYCKKDGDFFEKGVMSAQGQRKDLEVIKKKIEEGIEEVDIAEQHFSQWVVYRRSFAAYRQLLAAKVDRTKPRVEVLIGEAGVGKTRYVRHRHRGDDVWEYGGGGWFDGYDGQRVALFDDFSGDCPFELFLRVLDRYRCRVPVKGSFVYFYPKTIYITSNKSPDLWYSNLTRSQYAALARRLDRVEHVTDSIYSD